MAQLIFSKMIEAQRLFGKGGIEKNSRNDFQKFNYRSVDSTIAAANAIFSEVGIFVIPTSTDSVWAVRDVLDKYGKPRTDFTLQARYTFTFYAEDGSSVAAAHIPCANTSQDDSKLLGQTLSYAYKEVLFKTFSIPVEGTEDVDSLDANRNQASPPKVTASQAREDLGLTPKTTSRPLPQPKLSPHHQELADEIDSMKPVSFPKPPAATKRRLANNDSEDFLPF